VSHPEINKNSELLKINQIAKELRTRYFTLCGVLSSVLIAIIILVLWQFTYLTTLVVFPNFTVFLVAVLFFAVTAWQAKIAWWNYHRRLPLFSALIREVEGGKSVGDYSEALHRILQQ
jgi:hypothetical protein